MEPKHQNKAIFFCFLLVGTILAACSTSSYINVRYQLPPASNQLQGKAVYLSFKDMRSKKMSLSESAKKDFKNFSGLFSLYLAREKMKDELLGGFKVDSLFMEAFKKRLEAMGVKTLPAPQKGTPTIELSLKEFFLDYKSRKWITTVDYQTRLITPSGNAFTKSVSTSREQIKILGKREVEKYLSAIFTDSLNMLDIAKLFEQAGI